MKKTYFFLVFISFLQIGISQPHKENSIFWLKDTISSLNDFNDKNTSKINFHKNLSQFSELENYYFIENQFTLYLVVNKTESDKSVEDLIKVYDLEKQSLNLELNSKSSVFTNSELVSELDQDVSKKLIKINYYEPEQKKGILSLDFLKNEALSFDFFEMVLFPKLLSKQEKIHVDTYFLLKYGFASPHNVLALTENDTLLKVEESMNKFNRNLFGLGKSNSNSINQKQAESSSDNLIRLGLNEIEILNSTNTSSIDDEQYLFIGDNGNKINFEEDKVDAKYRLEKVWQINKANFTAQNREDANQLIIEFDSQKLDLDINEDNYSELKLLVSSDSNFKEVVYKFPVSIDEDKKIVYELELNEFKEFDAFFFTFERFKDLHLVHEYTPACLVESNQHELEIEIKRGAIPYQIDIINSSNEVVYSDSFTDEKINFKYPSKQSHTLRVTDANNTIFEEEISYLFEEMQTEILTNIPRSIDFASTSKIKLSNYLDESIIDYFEFKWLDKDLNLIKDGTSINLTGNENNLHLEAMDSFACACQFEINIQEDLEKALFIHPNPVKVGEEFFIELRDLIDINENFDVEIYDPQNQLITTLVLNERNHFNASSTPLNLGVYKLLIKTDKTLIQTKLIVH